MSYTLKIGELNNGDVKNVTLPNAPAYGEITDYTNVRMPSYSDWKEAMKFVGLWELMFEQSNRLMRDHPGCVPLTPEHKLIIDQVYEAFYKKYPNCKPGYSDSQEWPEENAYAVRLEWLKFWVDWALENCEKPVFYNS